VCQRVEGHQRGKYIEIRYGRMDPNSILFFPHPSISILCFSLIPFFFSLSCLIVASATAEFLFPFIFRLGAGWVPMSSLSSPSPVSCVSLLQAKYVCAPSHTRAQHCKVAKRARGLWAWYPSLPSLSACLHLSFPPSFLPSLLYFTLFINEKVSAGSGVKQKKPRKKQQITRKIYKKVLKRLERRG